MNTIKIDKYFKGMVANRGLSGIETENTIFAFLAAANRSYSGISGDLNVSRDGQIIVTYDDTLLRLGLLNLYIPSFNYDELKKFSLVDRKTANLNSNLFIPKLNDLLSICHSYRKNVFLNIHETVKHEYLDKIIEQVEEFDYLKKTFFLTDNRKSLLHLKKKIDHSQMYLNVEKFNDEVYDFCNNNGFNIFVKHHHLTKDLVKTMHLVGLKVGTGVVNDKELAERLIIYDVDYVFTDILE